jgi:hypothetical protein
MTPQRLILLLAMIWISQSYLSPTENKSAPVVDALQSGGLVGGRKTHIVPQETIKWSIFRRFYKETSGDADGGDECGDRAPAEEQSTKSFTSTITLDSNTDLSSLQAQAAKLREEAKQIQLALQKEREDKIVKETEKVDRWIEELLIEAKVNENTELLKTVDQVWERLKDDRYSAEQVNKIFKRLCELRQQESRSNQSPLMSLLVDAACKLDCMEREDNPNKRWNHKVERGLQKKLFARDWNIDLDDDDDAGNPWKLR